MPADWIKASNGRLIQFCADIVEIECVTALFRLPKIFITPLFTAVR
jgi:hypothetical protein